ncbi:MAG: flippase-like domain-containing protein [Erysipelotrichales bacterium]|nr:flippase-like domain-containing protein [Erysipelotrichales bacterium]
MNEKEPHKEEPVINNLADEKSIAKKNYFFVVIILIILLIWFFTQNDIDDAIQAVRDLNYYYFFLAILSIFLFMFFNSVSIDILLKKNNQRLSFFDSILIGNIGHFYNGITPFAAGGQAFQMYYYRKFGVPSSVATGTLIMNFIIYQFCIVIFSLIAIIFYFSQLTQNVSNFYIFFIIGFSLNVLILTILFLLAYSKIARKILTKIIFLFAKIGFIGRIVHKRQDRLENYLTDFQRCSKILIKDIKLMAVTVFFQLFSMACYFVIPFLIFRALGVSLSASELFFTMAMTSFAVVFMSFIPTPGAAGGAEFAFRQLFTIVIISSAPVILAGTLLWRVVSYYILMLISLLSLFILRRRYRNANRHLYRRL